MTAENEIGEPGHRFTMVENVLSAHPGVNDCAVIETQGLIAAFVVPSDEYLDSVLGRKDAETAALRMWRKTYDLTQFTKEAASAPVGFNTLGWNSTYTLQPISADEMREWLQTIDCHDEAAQFSRNNNTSDGRCDFLHRTPTGVAGMTTVLDDEREMSFKHDHTLVGLVLGACVLLATGTIGATPTTHTRFAGTYASRSQGDTTPGPSLDVSLGLDGTATVTEDAGNGIITHFGHWVETDRCV